MVFADANSMAGKIGQITFYVLVAIVVIAILRKAFRG